MDDRLKEALKALAWPCLGMSLAFIWLLVLLKYPSHWFALTLPAPLTTACAALVFIIRHHWCRKGEK